MALTLKSLFLYENNVIPTLEQVGLIDRLHKNIIINHELYFVMKNHIVCKSLRLF